mmetsp:Transcript_1422/g.2681  ORF Transcript_1422/g.2681 Transcript_1422/m.2681 type:complete len:213 (+) Transcript_1422:861-1499(+)
MPVNTPRKMCMCVSRLQVREVRVKIRIDLSLERGVCRRPLELVTSLEGVHVHTHRQAILKRVRGRYKLDSRSLSCACGSCCNDCVKHLADGVVGGVADVVRLASCPPLGRSDVCGSYIINVDEGPALLAGPRVLDRARQRSSEPRRREAARLAVYAAGADDYSTGVAKGEDSLLVSGTPGDEGRRLPGGGLGDELVVEAVAIHPRTARVQHC